MEEILNKFLDFINKTDAQLNRTGWETGMSDGEFQDDILEPLRVEIQSRLDEINSPEDLFDK